MRKADRKRPYPPDFVSTETLAYRLDCSERMVQDYVKAGILPKPQKIGNIVRWLWQDVQECIASMNGVLAPGNGDGQDDYSAGLQKIRQKTCDHAA